MAQGNGFHTSTREWLAEAIKAWREERGFSQKKAAQIIGLSVEALRALEECRAEPGPRVIELLEQNGVYIPVPFREKNVFKAIFLGRAPKDLKVVLGPTGGQI